ncbi:TfdA family taurine catabolism dioxygenase TauD [Massarina eburnea CBS 473.64]|uniref:TfdA family taurine catabolism dioxygenase TauD n=1 Tax=Massarina eburnea CBS 473.64 TaxID=1395130 RepID=A0A6A6RKR5_9PLEO|nr:TfdA family taurine catabolism dioxygenase TauD [Massarina eburnea CBS 473.64]
MAIAELTRPGPIGQPDIGYTPNYDKFLARTKRRLATEKLDKTLPPGFPQKLESDLVWDNTDIGDRYDWTFQLTPSDLEEVEEALKHFKSLEKPLGYVNQETFPLPQLHAKLRQVSKEIHEDFGFKVVRGVPVDQHTREEVLIIYAGLASHIAPVRGRQDHQFDGKPADVAVNHIKDMSAKVDASKIGAPAYTTDKQVFHTDSGDIIALLCLETAAEGGKSKLSSSWRVYNELAETRPDIIRTLAGPWQSEVFDGQGTSYVTRPLLFHQPASTNPTGKDRLIIQYARRVFTGFQGLPRSSSIPPITEAQAEALDALHFLAEKHALSLDFQKGDIQFVNNLSIFHARDGFTNTPDKQRHLVRLWLRDEEFAWKLPEELGGRWDKVFKGVTEEGQVFPLEPYVRSSALGKEGEKEGAK